MRASWNAGSKTRVRGRPWLSWCGEYCCDYTYCPVSYLERLRLRPHRQLWRCGNHFSYISLHERFRGICMDACLASWQTEELAQEGNDHLHRAGSTQIAASLHFQRVRVKVHAADTLSLFRVVLRQVRERGRANSLLCF